MDEFGFPQMAVANRILLNMENYGESKDDLEKSWEKWVHHIPFDSPVARALSELYTQKLEKLDEKNHAAAHQRLKRKLDLVQQRAERYNISSFTQAN